MYKLNHETAFKQVKKVWGYEYWFVNCKEYGYCLKGMVLEPGHQCSLHRHSKAETFLITEGKMIIEIEKPLSDIEFLENNKYECENNIINTISYCVIAGDTIIISPNEWHRFISAGMMPCRFIEVSQFHDDEDVQRVPGEESR